MSERKSKLIDYEITKVMTWQELQKINKEKDVRRDKKKVADKWNR